MKNLSSEAYVQHAARRLFYAYYKFLKSLSENFHFTYLQYYVRMLLSHLDQLFASIDEFIYPRAPFIR
jgi:hypothetical protein